MRDGLAISVISIMFSFLVLAEPKPKPVTDIKEVIINGEVYKKIEK